jgi:AcrR family transcriptional regulator
MTQALDVLAREGGASLRIDHLARLLGVTKGSFYWHFEDRADFVRRTAQHWAHVNTEEVADQIEALTGDAAQRLLRLMEMIDQLPSARHEVAMRAWSALEPDVAKVMRRVDARRLRVVRGLFEELGFTGDELEMRARTFFVYQSLERSLFMREPVARRRRLMRRRHALLVRR